jgi:hypothetical protein
MRPGLKWAGRDDATLFEVAGADAIIALRCCVLSGRFEDIWERRSALAGAERWPRSHEDVVRPALVIQGMCVQGV